MPSPTPATTAPRTSAPAHPRSRAAEWGTLIALLALPPRYRILPSQSLAALFERALPGLVRPDAPAAVTLSPAEKAAAAR